MSTSNSGTTQTAKAHAELYFAGVEIRKKVMGEDYVKNQLSMNTSEFAQPMQQLATEIGWGTIWTRPGLDLKQRSLIVIALLASKNCPIELAGHIRGAANNGATEVEIRETLLQTAVYCGAPVGMASFRIADTTIQQLKDEGKLVK